MSSQIQYIDRQSGEKKIEKVYGEGLLRLLYGKNFFAPILAPLISKNPFFSRLVGFWQKRAFTAKNVPPFVKKYGMDPSEFLLPPDQFTSFNAFFCRKLKNGARPLSGGENTAIIPADGRYLFFEKISNAEGFLVKGEKFSLETLLQNNELAKEYREGSLVIARLCPTDCHRFHFPASGIPGPAHLINGPLFSVNPIALKKNIHILGQNKREITELLTKQFGKVLIVEVGATSVGTIHQTYTPLKEVKRGEEKGFFSFGGSSLLLLFAPNAITFDNDLLKNTSQNIETLCLMGQSLGCAKQV